MKENDMYIQMEDRWKWPLYNSMLVSIYTQFVSMMARCRDVEICLLYWQKD